MTAHALVAERQRCLEAGMNDHVCKPIDPEALFATLMRWVKLRRPPRAGAAARPAKPPDDILPEIDGVDLADALKRVAGNKRLHRDLLVQFAAKQSDVDSRISAAIESGDCTLAEQIIHTVKGVAGNIGLGPVFSALETLERAIREGDAVATQARIEEFAQVLRRQVRAIRHATQDVKPSLSAEGDGSQGFDAEAVSAAITHLRLLLESGDGDAPVAFLALEGALAGVFHHPRLSALSAAISEFDFDRALLTLDEITKDCGVNWEHAK